MDLIFTGILLGLTLSIMTGPIFITLVQTGIERGFRAGVTVASGFWTSDFLYIFVISYAISFLLGLSDAENFEVFIGLIGGGILLVFGLILFFYGRVPAQKGEIKKPQSGTTYLGYWSLGFFMNTFNPGTFLFWVGVTSVISESLQLDLSDAMPFFGGLMGTIIITDIIKVALAKRISAYLTNRVLLLVRRIAGLILGGFGVTLLLRVLYQVIF